MGRDKVLKQLHETLQQHSTLAITAVRGMGGVGKTELARQYGLRHLRQKSYSGGICWLYARNQDIVSQLISFARTSLGLQIPEDIKGTEAILHYCWNYWPKPAENTENNVLIILDDVTNYSKLKPYLPPTGSRFKVLITTRLQLNLANSITLEVLEPGDGLNLLQRWVKDIDTQLSQAEELCQRLGYLPLALNLVGNYIQQQDISIAEMLSRLEEKGLKHPSLNVDENDPSWTLDVERGVQAAFELSWVELSEMARVLAGQLSLYALAPIPWKLIEALYPIPPERLPPPQGLKDWLLRPILYLWRSLQRKMQKWVRKKLENARVELERVHFIERVDSQTYQLHQLTRKFFRQKLEENQPFPGSFKKGFVQLMVSISYQVPEQLILTEINAFEPIIPHWVEITENWINWVKDNQLICLFTALGKFYNSQGLYSDAEPWYQQCLETCRNRLGDQHSHVATSLNNLASLYFYAGRYQQAEPLCKQALQIYKVLLGDQHSHVATNLNNLALIYHYTGRYEQAETLHQQALQVRKILLGEHHPDVAQSLYNIALLYESTERYQEAETLCLKALEMYKALLGENHPDVAYGLNNLASLYKSTGRYEQAETFYLEALKIRKALLGENHPDVADNLNNLALLYKSTGSYQEAEILYLEALEIRKALSRENHPHVAYSLNNLALLYKSTGSYQEAETSFVKAIKIATKILGEYHPKTQTFRQNYYSFLKQVAASDHQSELSEESLQILSQME